MDSGTIVNDGITAYVSSLRGSMSVRQDALTTLTTDILRMQAKMQELSTLNTNDQQKIDQLSQVLQDNNVVVQSKAESVPADGVQPANGDQPSN